MKCGKVNKLLRFFVLVGSIVLVLAVYGPWGAASAINWTVHQLTDGSGSIRLPSDWKLTYSDFSGGVSAEGPADQSISLGRGMDVTYPNAPYAAQYQAAGIALVAPFSDPATALKNLIPQLNAISRRKGGPIHTLDKITAVQPDSSQIPNAKAAWVHTAFTRKSSKGVVHLRGLARYECWPGAVGWKFITSFEMAAPDATFDRDLQTMIEIGRSWKLNDEQVYGNTRRYLDNTNSSFNDALHSIQKSQDRTRERSSKGWREGTMGTERVKDPDTGKIAEVPLGSWNQGRGCYVNPKNNKCYVRTQPGE